MSSKTITLPNEVIRVIILHCQSAKDYLSQSLINHQWLSEAQRLKSLMKARFSRQLTLLHCRVCIWDFDIRATVIGYGQHIQRHGLEECVQLFHRVGGPGCCVYYLERHWQDGKLHGLEILREINTIWCDKYNPNYIEKSDELLLHPYEGLAGIDSMKKYRRHPIVPKNATPPDGYDYLGEILFKYEWTSTTLEESKQIRQNLTNFQQSDFAILYDFIDNIDLCSTYNSKH